MRTHHARAGSLLLLLICTATCQAQSATSLHPLPATPVAAAPAALAAAVTPTIASVAAPTAVPRATVEVITPPPAPAAALPVTYYGNPMVTSGYPAVAMPAAQPALNPYNPYTGYLAPTAPLPTTSQASAFPTGALPATALPTTQTAIQVPPVRGAGAVAGGIPAADPVAAVPTDPTLPAGLLPVGMAAATAEVPAAPAAGARPVAPPAPPIPKGADFKPQWNTTRNLTANEVIASFNVGNTPEQVYWSQNKLREALAKTAGVPATAVFYHQVLPTVDGFGGSFTTVRFVVQQRNAKLASDLLTTLAEQDAQSVLKERIGELKLDMIAGSVTLQTPAEFQAAEQGAAGLLPSTTGGLGSAGMFGPGIGPLDAAPLPGTAAAAAATGGAFSNPMSTAGLPGAPSGGISPLAARRAAARNAAHRPCAAVCAILPPLLLVASALLLL